MDINKVYNGNAYELIKKVADKSIDVIYTDIPYLFECGWGGSSELAQRIIKKNVELADIKDGIDYTIFDEFIRVSKKLNCFIWCSKLQIPTILNYFVDKGYFYEILAWCKTNPTPATKNIWLPDIEYCLYFREKGVVLNDGYENKSKWYSTPINKADKDLYEHPTIKPLELVKRHLKHTTPQTGGVIILDPFIGSGTTAVACKELGYNYIGFELNEKYYKIAVERINGIDKNGQMDLFNTNFEQLDLFK